MFVAGAIIISILLPLAAFAALAWLHRGYVGGADTIGIKLLLTAVAT